jgi:hypothetical protein
MMDFFSIELWIAVLFMVNFVLVLFLFAVLKRVNHMDRIRPAQGGENEGLQGHEGLHDPDGGLVDKEQAAGSALTIVKMLEPLVEESRRTAIRFDEQIKEKKRLIRELNDALDSRIISINLLLSRSDALQKRLEERQNRVNLSSFPAGTPDLNTSSFAVLDQQNQIIELFQRDVGVDAIAQRLSVPKGEVQLVIDLKKKFLAMEKNST